MAISELSIQEAAAQTLWGAVSRTDECAHGKKLVLTVQTINSKGEAGSYRQHIEIDEVHGGGVFGRVLFPKDKGYVIKTTKPESPLKEFLRYANWGYKEFPSRVSEEAAILDY